MSIKDDIRKADEIAEIDGKIGEINKEITAILDKYKLSCSHLESEMNNKIKARFLEKVNDSSLTIQKTDDVITAKYGSLEYGLAITSSSTKTSVQHKKIHRSLDRATYTYEFQYTFPSLPPHRSVSFISKLNEIERKLADLKSLEEHLSKYQKAFEELEKHGIKLEYAQLEPHWYNAPSNAFREISIDQLLSLIFG